MSLLTEIGVALDGHRRKKRLGKKKMKMKHSLFHWGGVGSEVISTGYCIWEPCKA